LIGLLTLASNNVEVSWAQANYKGERDRREDRMAGTDCFGN